MNIEDINTLILKSLSGELDQPGESKLKEWIEYSKENHDYYESIKNTWSSINVPRPENIPDFDILWSEIEPKLSSYQTVFSLKKSKNNISELFKNFIFNLKFSMAAVIILILTGILVYFFYDGSVSGEFYTKNAEMKTITLPDNSRIVLNAASKLDYTIDDNNRVVNLQGEALFTVDKNEKPFIIKTFNAIIKVTGTKFNVRSRNDRTSVIVENGTVLFSSLYKGAGRIVLGKNQMSQCVNKGLPEYPLKVEANNLNSWVNKKLVFEQIPLVELVEELTRYYNVDIIVMNKAIENERITGTFQNQTVEEVLNAVTKSINCRFKNKGKSIILY